MSPPAGDMKIDPDWLEEGEQTKERASCPLCLMVMVQAAQACTQGHAACHDCYVTELSLRKRCPTCKENTDARRLQKCRTGADFIGDLRMRCKHGKDGEEEGGSDGGAAPRAKRARLEPPQPMSNDDLRNELGRRGLSTNGRKGEMAARLEENRRSEAGEPCCDWRGKVCEFSAHLAVCGHEAPRRAARAALTAAETAVHTARNVRAAAATAVQTARAALSAAETAVQTAYNARAAAQTTLIDANAAAITDTEQTDTAVQGSGAFRDDATEIMDGSMGIGALWTIDEDHVLHTEVLDRLVSYVVQDFKSKHGIDRSGNARALRRARSICRLYFARSCVGHCTVQIGSFFEGIDSYTTITRTTVEELCADLFPSSSMTAAHATLSARAAAAASAASDRRRRSFLSLNDGTSLLDYA